MLHAIWERAFAHHSDLVNLEEDLRCQLAGRLALLLIGAGGLAMLVFLPQEPFPLIAFGLLAMLFALVWSLGSFDLVYGLTQGGPGVATSVLALQIFREGIMFFKFGFASAISVVLLILVAIIGVIGLWLFRKAEVTY